MRFSILTLLAATGYVALVCAAFVRPLPYLHSAATAAWFAMVTFSLVLATDSSHRGKAAFGRVMVGGVTAYFLLLLVSQNVLYANQRDFALPHEAIAAMFESPTTTQFQPSPLMQYKISGPWGEVMSQRSFREFIAAQNTAVVVGLIGGSIALWRYRRNEKAHRESGGP